MTTKPQPFEPAIETRYSAEQAMHLAELWEQGKMIGGSAEEVCQSLLVEIRRLQEGPQPFETAPKDGRIFLAFNKAAGVWQPIIWARIEGGGSASVSDFA